MEEKIAIIIGITWCVVLSGLGIYCFIEYLFNSRKTK
jgi:hypothetical protein